MILQCERCKQERDCQFYGYSADVEEEQAQNGEWLCKGCVAPRLVEVDEACDNLKKFLEED